jgi:hypothetical protein
MAAPLESISPVLKPFKSRRLPSGSMRAAAKAGRRAVVVGVEEGEESSFRIGIGIVGCVKAAALKLGGRRGRVIVGAGAFDSRNLSLPDLPSPQICPSPQITQPTHRAWLNDEIIDGKNIFSACTHAPVMVSSSKRVTAAAAPVLKRRAGGAIVQLANDNKLKDAMKMNKKIKIYFCE